MTVPFPALFVSHGSPAVALGSDGYTASLERLGGSLPRPRAAVVLSAHGQARAPLRVTSGERPPTIHDFTGFPPELYSISYPSPGAPGLANDIAARLSGAGLPAVPDERRGLDHGAWVPLRLMYPDADVPVVEVSFSPLASPDEFVRMGRALAELRLRDILLVGSGGIVHNLSMVRFEEKDAPVDGWARAFDAWVRDRVAGIDLESLLSYRSNAPHAERAAPTSEHFDPLFFILGAAAPADRADPVYEGFHHGNLSMRTFLLRSDS